MKVHVRVPTALRELAAGRATLEFDLVEAATVAHLLDAVGAAHPALERRVRNERGMVRAHVNLFVGEDDVRALDGTDTVLQAGDDVTILAAISGG